jgi:protein-disulfide isomerase
MERLVVAAVLVAVAVAAAFLLERRRRDAPTQGSPRTYPVPQQLDRSDFDRPDVPWLVVVFTSATCDTCAKAVQVAAPLASDRVAVVEVESAEQPDLHQRYGIEAVPTLVVADAAGVVQGSFVGPPDAAELWAAMASVRDAAEPGDQG